VVPWRSPKPSRTAFDARQTRADITAWRKNINLREFREAPRFPLAVFLILLAASPAAAYIGPGAGFGIVTSFLVFLNAILASLLSALLWPLMMAIRFFRRRRRELKASARRVIILGLDGLSPHVASELMDAGEMPNLSVLRKKGTFARLGTTCPGISPVAWSSFMTGVNPGKHGIFDFLAPDRNRYLAVLSSVKTGESRTKRGIGPFMREVSRPFVTLLRRGTPFWSLLGRYGIRSTILRVPITYPPEPLDGHLLSGMCVPDVRGTQGSYTLFTTVDPGRMTGGLWRRLERDGDLWRASLPGPGRPDGTDAEIPLTLRKDRKGFWKISAGGAPLALTEGRLSDWLSITFRLGRGRVSAIARFRLTFREESPELYCSALHVDPFHPALPISQPVHYSKFLAGIQGPFATLGLAEDTWALNNGALSEEGFLDQAWAFFEERRRMFLDALELNRSGLVVCVFDTSDRIQHMFWGGGTGEGSTIREMYRRMDGLIGTTMERMQNRDMLIVMSDHGFTAFHTCVDFNRWLLERGYLVLEEGVETAETSFAGVDWSRTRAWSIGLAGIMLNVKGRESKGIVDPSEAPALVAEICSTLLELAAPDGTPVVSAAFPGSIVYSGPYSGQGPDIIVGTREGFRAGWGCVTGGVGPSVIYPNDRHWDGDHCHDHRLVPGTFACSMPLDARTATILDIAPTVLSVLGVKPPDYLEGRSLLEKLHRDREGD
jgi:predicted AlkP superfamily phosphohydrolase/phosphomutase